MINKKNMFFVSLRIPDKQLLEKNMYTDIVKSHQQFI